MRIKPFGKVSLEEVNDYMEAVEFTIPEIYVYFLTQTNGGTVEEKSLSFSVSETDESIFIDSFLGFDLSQEQNIVTVNNELKKDLPPNALVIGVGSDGYYVLVNNTTDSLLYFWDVNQKLNVSNEKSNAYLISDSFEKFWIDLGKIFIDEGEPIMEKIPYVPLGSIILLNGSYEKIIIVGRGLIVKNSVGNNVIFDYAGVTYPEGLVGDQVAYFNHTDIAKVVFEGFSDESDTITVDNINKYINDHPEIQRGSVENWE